MFIPFARPDIDDAEIAAVVAVLKTGILTGGAQVTAFEQAIARYLGNDVAVAAVSSATAGLHLALTALGISPGDEVITTPLTFTATAEAIALTGARPVLVDIDPDTLNIDPAQVEAAITPRTKAILPVHLTGLACQMDVLGAIARRWGLKIIEDAAQALGSSFGGKLVGAIPGSNATIFSFHATKPATCGEGGAIVSGDRELIERCREMRLHGIHRPSNRPRWDYDVAGLGYKYNLNEMAAAIGLTQIQKLDKGRDLRLAIASAYNSAFADLPVLLPKNDIERNWHLYVLQLLDVERDWFIAQMESLGIGCSVHYKPLHWHSFWAKTLGYDADCFPHAVAYFRRCVSLPIYAGMKNEDVERAIAAVRNVLLSR